MKPSKQAQFEALLAEHKDRLYRICRANVYDQSQVEDLYQDVLVKLWQHMDQFKGNSKWSTWMYRVAVNTAITYNRRKKRHQAVFVQTEPNPSAEPLAVADGEMETEQLLQQLQYCIQQLKEGDRLLISLQLEGMSYQQIAEISGLTVNHVGVKLNRIRKQLSTLMKEKHGTG